MLTKQYIIRGNNYIETPSIVKISYGTKYVIAKCMNQPATLKRIENSLNSFIRGGKNNPDGLYYFLNEYVKKHPGQIFKVETILASDSPYDLLKEEQLQLDEGFKAKKLLNNQQWAYLPAFNEENQMYGGWIRPVDVLNFTNWLKKHKKSIASKRKKVRKPAQ